MAVNRPYVEDLRGTRPDYGPALNDRDKEHVKRVTDRVREWSALTRDHQGSWLEAVQYVSGRMDVYWSSKMQRLRPEPALPRRSHHRANFIMRTVEQLLSVLTREEPEPDVIPVSSEFSAWEKAENTRVVLKHDYRELGIGDIIDETYRWSLVTGIGWMRYGWDPDAGDMVSQEVFETYRDSDGYMARRPAIMDDGMPVTVDGFTGRPYVRTVSPFNIIVDLASARLTDRGVFQPRYIIEQNLYPLESIERAYPETKGGLLPERTLEQNHLRELLYGGSRGGIGLEESEKLVMVYEEWTPCQALSKKERKKYPTGRCVKVCQGFVLEEYKNPYGGRIPYVPFECYPVLGRFMPQGLVPHLIPQQKVYNRMASKENDSLIYSVSKLVMPRKAKQGEGHLRTEAGEVLYMDIRETGGQMPSYLQAPDVTAQYERKQALIKNEIQDIAGVHEALQGQNPPGGRSGRLAFANIQANLLSHSRLERSYKRRLAQVYEGIAFCERKFGFSSRTFAIVGPEVQASKTMTPMDSLEYADIDIKTMSTLSISEPASIEFVMNLWSAGALVTETGQPDVKELRRLLKLGRRSDLFEEEMMVERNTTREIEAIVEGMTPSYGPGPDGTPMMVNPAANLEVVHKTYRRFLNSAKYLMLPPNIQRALLDRWDIIVASLQGMQIGGNEQEGAAGPPGGQGMQGAAGGADPSGVEAGLSRALSSGGQGGPF